LRALNAIRSNFAGESVAGYLQSRVNAKINLPVAPTRLYTHNVDVDIENNLELQKISGKEFCYKMELVGPAAWHIAEEGKIKAEISQYPLRLAWAITIHKSQGMSLDAARVDLRQSFEPGMGYVALSRVRSSAGLSLAGFNEISLQVNGEVFEFDKDLKRRSEISAREIAAKIPRRAAFCR